MDVRERVEEIFTTASLDVAARPGNGRYAHSPFVSPGVRFSAAHTRGYDEFGVDFQNREGLARAAELDRALRLFGLERRDLKPRDDLNAYRWRIAPLPDGSVDARTIRTARNVLCAILGIESGWGITPLSLGFRMPESEWEALRAWAR